MPKKFTEILCFQEITYFGVKKNEKKSNLRCTNYVDTQEDSNDKWYKISNEHLDVVT